MLEQFQTNTYRFEDYLLLNDNLLYLDYINNNYQFKEVTIEPVMSYRYRGNLIGLFREMNLDPALYVYTQYINGFVNPQDFDGTMTTMKIAIQPPIPPR